MTSVLAYGLFPDDFRYDPRITLFFMICWRKRKRGDEKTTIF
jgi:hypothetical protein